MKQSIVVIIVLLFAGLVSSTSRANIYQPQTHVNYVEDVTASAGCTNVEVTVNYDAIAINPLDNTTNDFMAFVTYDGNGTAIARRNISTTLALQTNQSGTIDFAFLAQPVSYPFFVRIYDTNGAQTNLTTIQNSPLIHQFDGIDPTSFGATDCDELMDLSPPDTPTPGAGTPGPCTFGPGYYEVEATEFLSCADYDELEIGLLSDDSQSGGYGMSIPAGEIVSWEINGSVIVIYRRIGDTGDPWEQDMELCFGGVCELVDNTFIDADAFRWRQPVAIGTTGTGVYAVSVESITNQTVLDSFLVLDTEGTESGAVVMFPPPDPARYYADVDGQTVAVDLVMTGGDIILSVLLFTMVCIGLIRWMYQLWKS